MRSIMEREHHLPINTNRRKFIQYTGALIGGIALAAGNKSQWTYWQ